MLLILKRRWLLKGRTVGELYLDRGTHHDFLCYTLEDEVRFASGDSIDEIKHKKVYGQTAIPDDTYEIAVTWSNRFNQFMPLLLNVLGFVGIRIHKGNTAKDTHGCILVGDELTMIDNITQSIKAGTSTPAYDKVFKLINRNIKKEKIFIRIEYPNHEF